jgi:hypothetical protein
VIFFSFIQNSSVPIKAHFFMLCYTIRLRKKFDLI